MLLPESRRFKKMYDSRLKPPAQAAYSSAERSPDIFAFAVNRLNNKCPGI
jgi:hypothetical protein